MIAHCPASGPLRRGVPALWLGLCAAILAAMRGASHPADLPPIVFVSRQPAGGADAGQIPGLGPHGSTIAVGGRLLLRTRDGLVRELLPPGALYDVQDPDVSWDAKRVVFSGLATRTGHWRLYVLKLATGKFECITADTQPPNMMQDDFDPCWNGERIVFARASGGARSLYDTSRVAALFEWRARAGEAQFVLSEANGVLDPVIDTRRGTLLFSRWWFNPWLPRAEGGVTRDASEAMTRDTVNQWQLIETAPGAGAFVDAQRLTPVAGARLRAGGVPDRRAGMGVQPALVGDAIVATYARNAGLAPTPGPTGVHLMRGAPSAGLRLAGAAIGDDLANPYSEGSGLSAPTACAPAALPDGRLIVSFAAGARGDFGLWLLGLDGTRTLVHDTPGTLELDAAPVVERAGTPLQLNAVRAGSAERSMRERMETAPGTFRFLDEDVFRGRGAPRRQSGARLRFLALGSSRNDTTSPRIIAEVAIPRRGRIDLRLKPQGPLFEQLVDANGRVLMSAHGPAQVRGFNTPPAGTEARCLGCHLGHSALR
ncbi:MAG: hypothetical protein ABIU54_07210 [Candidatus Eisenbacteria bacterium]